RTTGAGASAARATAATSTAAARGACTGAAAAAHHGRHRPHACATAAQDPLRYRANARTDAATPAAADGSHRAVVGAGLRRISVVDTRGAARRRFRAGRRAGALRSSAEGFR